MADLSPLKDALLGRVPNREGVGCFLCRLILEDIVKNGRLTGAIKDGFSSPIFPPDGMIKHLDLEGFGKLVPSGWRPKPAPAEH